MYHIVGEIEGVVDLLFNAWTKRAIDGLIRPNPGGRLSQAQMLEEAEQKVHRNGKRLVIPKANQKKCLLAGIKLAKLKEGRGSLIPYVEATVFAEKDMELDREKFDYMHEAIGRNENTGQAIWILRPAVRAPWRGKYSFFVTDDRRNADTLRRGWEEAGLLNGLGSFRPEYGRFLVKSWEVVKSTKK